MPIIRHTARFSGITNSTGKPADLLLSRTLNQHIDQPRKFKATMWTPHPGCNQPASECDAHLRGKLLEIADQSERAQSLAEVVN